MTQTEDFLFDTSTQFTWDGDAIALCQGSVPIAKGYLSHWLLLFQSCDKLEGVDQCISISENLSVQWNKVQDAIAIRETCEAMKSVLIKPKQLETLENGLQELHQGCCGPVSFNFVAEIMQEPDEILDLLQDITRFKLTDSQIEKAKESISFLSTEYEPEVMDLHDMWEFHPDLNYFAKALRFYFLAA